MRDSIALILGAILFSNPCIANANDLTISVGGECPGTVDFAWQGATPNRTAGLCYSRETGRYVLPGPPCSGTTLGLGPSGIRLVRAFRTGSGGEGQYLARAAAQACGGYLQLLVIDEPECQTSNVAQIPR